MTTCSEHRFADTPLAIIGMACRLPGANDLHEYWSLMIEGRSAIVELPLSRLDRERYYDREIGKVGKTYSTIGGIVPERHSPAGSFRLSQDDIVNADPTHLELCQVAADALRDAGVDPDHPKPDRCGVFIGHQRGSTLIGDLSLNAMAGQALNCLRETEYFSQQSSDHQRSLVREMTARVRSDLPGWSPGGGPFLGSSEAARLISKAFGLDGPYASINAACSSSLVALATGAHALQMGDIEMAVVGGASNCKLDALILFSQAQTLSATGSRPFDATADGLVAAEGCVVVLVKTLQRAIADRDPIQAVIRGIGVSSDGKGKSLWAPRRDGQVAAIRRAYRQDTTPESVQYIEAHATSTPVGDSTEINSLGDVFAESIKPGGKIAIGSVKANIGHTLESAGLAGLVKTVLAMRHGVIPPLINLTQPNPKVDWQALPFVLPTSPMNWPQPTASNPKRAAINAFGIGGLNVHVTVEEYRASSRVSVATPNKQSTEDRSIAIVGASLMTPGARTIEAFWEMMTKGIDPKTAIPLDRWDVRIDHPAEAENWVGGFISGYQYDWKKHHVPPKQLTSADPLQFMILDAVGDALDRNDYLKRLDREHTAVVVANVVGGEYTEQLQVGLRLPVLRETLEEVLGAKGVPPDTIDSVSHHFAELVLRRMPALLDETGGFSNSSLATRVTKTYDLMGGAFAIDSGDNTSLAAIDSARRLLLCGGCSTVIVAAGQRSLGPGTFERLKRSGRLSAAGRSCALDRDSDGMAPAEGVAVVVLKRLSDARATGDEVLSVIREIGIARSDDAISAQRLAIRRALDGADVRSEQIAAVDLSACGVSSEDRNELEAIAGEYAGARPHPMHLRTLASQIGDAGGAAGLISLVKSSLSLRSLESPAGQPPRRPIVEPDFGSTMARWWQLPNANEPLLAPDPNGRVLAAIHSYSNGLACHLVLEREQAVETRRATPKAPSVSTNPNDESNDFGTWYAQADTVSSLLALASEIATGGSAEEATVDGVPARHGLAIVYRSRAELRKKAELFISRHEHPQRQAVFESQGIYSFDRRDQPLVAFLFPGQGSQYAGMLEPLIQQHSVASNVAAHIDTTLTALQYPTIHELFGDQDQQLGRDVWRTQLSVLVADTILYEVVSDMGIRPDRISSHSYGEFAALVAAGCWSFADAVIATSHRCRLITQSSQTDGAMMACELSGDDAQRWCDQAAVDAYVANSNSDQQTVIGGTRRAIERLHHQLRKKGVQAKVLSVPRPFHTPLMAPVQDPFRERLGDLTIQPPHVPLLSGVDNRYVAEPDQIRENLVAQLVQPVDYPAQINRLTREDVRVFVEVGPGQVLTRLHQQIIQDDCVVVSTDSKKRPFRETLARLDAAMKASGALAKRNTRVVVGQHRKATVQARTPTALPDPTPSSVEQPRFGSPLPVLSLVGSPEQMGVAHGRAMSDSIRRMLDRYQQIAGEKLGRGLPDLSTTKSIRDTLLDEAAMSELRGMADVADVGFDSLVEHNLYAHPDIGAGCTQLLIPTPDQNRSGYWLHAANEDMPLSLFLRETLQRCVQVRKPTNGIHHLLFSAAGHVSGINGINAEGVAITSSMLLDVPRRTGTLEGLLHSVLVRRVLESASSVEDAIEIIRGQRKTGGWGVCLSDNTGREPVYLEYDGQSVKLERVPRHRLVSNHAVLVSPITEAPAHSRRRLSRLESLFRTQRNQSPGISTLQGWLRDRYDESRERVVRFPTMNTVRRVDNQLSLVIDHARSCVWATAGHNTDDSDQDRFFELDLQELIGLVPRSAAVGAPGTNERVITWDKFSERSRRLEEGVSYDHVRNVCQRFAMRCLRVSDLPTSDIGEAFGGGVVLLGDNPVADHLSGRLRTAGIRCLRLRKLDEEATSIAALDAFSRGGVPTNFVLLSAFDTSPTVRFDREQWRRQRSSNVMVPYLICQRWFTLLLKDKLVDHAKVVGGVRLGGMFGFDDTTDTPEGGFTTGLIKGLLIEHGLAAKTSFCSRVVDFETHAEPNWVAARLVDESANMSSRMSEVSYYRGQRHVVTPVIQSVDEAPEIKAGFGNVWVITGGARGVTAKIAHAIGQRSGARLHLIGSSPRMNVDDAWRDLDPTGRKELRAQVVREALERGEVPIQAWSKVERALEIDQNLQELAAAGIHARYHTCDVSDYQALAAVLGRVRERDGQIEGIIHGAGYEKAASLANKKRENVDRTFASKVDGAVHLMELTKDDPLKCFVAFSSIAGRFGGVGQTDYCASNELLCKLTAWFRKMRPEVNSVAIDWPSWDEVGMAVRAESKIAHKLVDLKLMPVAEGVAHCLREIERGCPEAEVLITDWQRYKRFYPNDYVQSLRSSESGTDSVPTSGHSSDQVAVKEYPLIDQIERDTNGGEAESRGQSLTVSHLADPVRDGFLSQHLLRGRPIYPFVAAVEACAEAASVMSEGKPVTTIDQLSLAESLRFFTDRPQDIRVQATRDGDQIYCSLQSDFRNRKGVVLRQDRVHASCTVRFDDPLVTVDRACFPTAEYIPMVYLDHKLAIYHGPLYRQVESFHYTPEQSWAKMRIPDPCEFFASRSGQSVVLPCVLLDACVFCAGVHEWTVDRTSIALPRSIQRLRLISDPCVGESAIARIVPLESTDDSATFNIDVFDRDGSPILQIEEYRADVLVNTIPLDRAQVGKRG